MDETPGFKEIMLTDDYKFHPIKVNQSNKGGSDTVLPLSLLFEIPKPLQLSGCVHFYKDLQQSLKNLNFILQ